MTGGQWRRLGSASQLRLVLQVAALFIAVTVASFAYAWWVADQALRRTLEVTLDQEIAELQAEGSAQEVIDEVSQVTAADLETLVLRYEAPKPEAPVGTIALPFPPDQVAALVELQRGSDKELFLAKGAIAYGGRLSVAIPASDIEELSETFLRIFLWSIAPACLAALSGGLLLAQRSVRRVEAIEGTLTQLTEGRLSARMPPQTGPDDDLMRIGRAVDKLAVAQESSVEALRQVSADIAHDLKTPIQRLSVLIEAARGTATNSLTRSSLDQAAVECAGITETFQSLLDIAQIEGGSPRARFKHIDLSDLAASIVELYEPAAAEQRHKLSFAGTVQAPIVGDRALLGRLIANLIENALRHTPAGSRVEVRTEHIGLRSCLVVADDGPGIPEAERSKVTRRLYRLESSRTTSGNGLGLSLVEVIAKLHGAEFELVDNHPGLRAQVTFPTVRSRSPGSTGPGNDPHPQGDQGHPRPSLN